MFPIRRAALRLLSTTSVSLAARSRTVVTFNKFPVRVQQQTLSLPLQRRWASDETKKETPVSHTEPSIQEEAENTITEDNAARTVESSTEATSNAAETSNVVPTGAESGTAPKLVDDALSQDSAVDASQEAVTGAVRARGNRQPTEVNSRSSQRSTPSERDSGDARSQPKPTIYIGNLFFDVTEDDLTKELARFGDIKVVKLIRDARGLSKGFGYVTFSSIEAAKSAIESLHMQLFEGRRLTVGYAAHEAPSTPRRQNMNNRPLNPPSKTLFIGNMSWDVSDRDLNALFKGIRGVIDVRVAIDRRTGQPRGFAHADFVDVKSAVEAMEQLKGKETHGRPLRLDFGHASSNAPKNQARDRGDL